MAMQSRAPDLFSGEFNLDVCEKDQEVQYRKASENLAWLFANMHPYFFITMQQETRAILNLAARLHDLLKEKKIILADQDAKFIVARADVPGSIYDTLKDLRERDISYAEMSHSYRPVPGIGKDLEVMRFEFARKSPEEISLAGRPSIPLRIYENVFRMMKRLYPKFDFEEFQTILELLWQNDRVYLTISPSERIARVIHLYQQGKRHQGLYLDTEIKSDHSAQRESRILFSVGNPPSKGFLTQVSEVFQRLGIGVRRSYTLIINTGIHPYFLGTFYVLTHAQKLVEKDSELFRRLKSELYNTQILSTSTGAYSHFLANRLMTGEEASLTNALITFCHTVLAHCEPDRFGATAVRDAFHSEPEITSQLIRLFEKRFQPGLKDREKVYDKALKETAEAIGDYNTGHRYLDELRKTIFKTAASFITHTLKTNFFVPEKHAIAFRLDPEFLSELGPQFTADLPHSKPFRITFFFTRHGAGYHVGFSDIARGGWRTIICRNPDESTTNLNSLFREVFVLAHTQHLKNKDIYQGGSKLTIVLDATDLDSSLLIQERLYKVQYGVINAFLDIFVTEKGKAKDPNVIDYYRQEEPIEIGPDENMHDDMIEFIAQLSLKRGYILGNGIISSKRVGINHKEYGVTSRGVLKFAGIAMKEVGIDVLADRFTINFTGGPNGDVAGNSMRLILKSWPNAQIQCIVDGTAGLYDPEGVDRTELAQLVLRKDLEHFNPEALHPKGFILFRLERRHEGVRELYRKISRSSSSLREEWITADEFHKEIDGLLFDQPADLFLPCGGRPETIDDSNWQRLLGEDGRSRIKVITEGANSFITSRAREELQRRGAIVLRDASANKCGVISSSYEIIANLLMSEKEFMSHKKDYIRDVLKILEKKAESEAYLIFKRHRQNAGKRLYTEISNAISEEINEHYGRLFAFFQDRPELADQPIFQKAILSHLPALIGGSSKFRSRIKNLPSKIKYAILASEIGSAIVYRGGWELPFERRIRAYVKEQYVS